MAFQIIEHAGTCPVCGRWYQEAGIVVGNRWYLDPVHWYFHDSTKEYSTTTMNLCNVDGHATGSAHGMPRSGRNPAPAGDLADGAPHFGSDVGNAACSADDTRSSGLVVGHGAGSADGTDDPAPTALAKMAWADIVDDATNAGGDVPADSKHH